MRIIHRFLKAGKEGTPQGGLVSPVLANIYLHYVLDLWFEKRYARSCRGKAYLVRYADDFIACFQDEGDARRFVEELTKRLADFDLEVAPSKTGVLRFGSATTQNRERDGRNRPQTFNFLGLTHYVSRSRRGRFAVGRRTEGKRVRKKLQGAQPASKRAAPARRESHAGVLPATSGRSPSLLRRQWQLPAARGLCPLRQPDSLQMAQPPQSAPLGDLGAVRLSVRHFPPGTSKWNKIEHRMFCHITENWRGRPLISRLAVVELIAATRTAQGLAIHAELDETVYETGKAVSEEEMRFLAIERRDFHREWNYSVSPR